MTLVLLAVALGIADRKVRLEGLPRVGAMGQ